MQITILKIGSLKEKYFTACEKDFLKRLKPFAQLKIISGPAVPLKKTLTLAQVKEKEGQFFLKHIKKNPTAHVIALDQNGHQFSSEKLAAQIGQRKNQGQPIILLIGGPYGLAASVLDQAPLKLSFSALTFPHPLIYLFLLEQLYRSFTILSGKKYHY